MGSEEELLLLLAGISGMVVCYMFFFKWAKITYKNLKERRALDRELFNSYQQGYEDAKKEFDDRELAGKYFKMGYQYGYDDAINRKEEWL